MSGLVTHVARFGAALREHGVRVVTGDEMDAAEALGLVDVGDVDEVRLALLIALKIRARDRKVFDALFHRLWLMREARRSTSGAGRVRRTMPPKATVRLGGLPVSGDAASEEPPSGGVPGYSPAAQLRHKAFDTLTPHEMAAMDRLVARLSRIVATERSRRLVPTRGRGSPDLRRSFRRAVGTRGELLTVARRTRAVEDPRIVLLCDTSGSMEAQTRLLLALAISLKRTVRRVEVFVFNTSLTRVTQQIAPGKVALTLRRLGEDVADWAGGTRIGDSLAEFVTTHLNTVVNGRTTVVIMSDGLDRGDPDVLARAMRAIHARAREVIWLNPLMGDVDYEPTARGMAAALPHVDRLAPAHNFDSLERFVTMLSR